MCTPEVTDLYAWIDRQTMNEWTAEPLTLLRGAHSYLPQLISTYIMCMQLILSLPILQKSNGLCNTSLSWANSTVMDRLLNLTVYTDNIRFNSLLKNQLTAGEDISCGSCTLRCISEKVGHGFCTSRDQCTYT